MILSHTISSQVKSHIVEMFNFLFSYCDYNILFNYLSVYRQVNQAYCHPCKRTGMVAALWSVVFVLRVLSCLEV